MTTKSSTRPVLVLGCSGMLGNALLRFLAGAGVEAWGTVRTMPSALRSAPFAERIIAGVDVENLDSVVGVLAAARPGTVVNCVGLVKQLAEADDPLRAIPINALLPHRLARLSAAVGARFVHVSTDCVFSGSKGMYLESDPADAQDLYRILEQELIPAYYERDADGFPDRWAQLMRNSIASAIWRFSTTRMLHEYVERLYLPAATPDDAQHTTRPK